MFIYFIIFFLNLYFFRILKFSMSVYLFADAIKFFYILFFRYFAAYSHTLYYHVLYYECITHTFDAPICESPYSIFIFLLGH